MPGLDHRVRRHPDHLVVLRRHYIRIDPCRLLSELDGSTPVTETERNKTLAKYQAQHGISLHDTATVPTATVDSAGIDQTRKLVDAHPLAPTRCRLLLTTCKRFR